MKKYENAFDFDDNNFVDNRFDDNRTSAVRFHISLAFF